VGKWPFRVCHQRVTFSPSSERNMSGSLAESVAQSLHGTLSPDANIRMAAEIQLSTAYATPGKIFVIFALLQLNRMDRRRVHTLWHCVI
jgi:hypothetical protein